MPSVVFVHGTSVRYEAYAKTFTAFRQHLLQRRPNTQVVPCAWGDLLGSPPLDDLSLLPGERQREVAEPVSSRERAAERAQARRMMLDLAPLDELRLLALLWRGRSSGARPPFGGETAAGRLAELAQVMLADPALLELTESAGIAAAFPAVLAAMVDNDLVRECAESIGNVREPNWAIFADSFAEATIAEAFRVALPPSPQQFSAESREALASRMIDLLYGRQLGLPGAEKVLGLATAAASKAIQHWRGPFSAAVHPFVGDIFRYLAFGETLRQFIADTARRASPPVVLVGHSLGGIACLDVLARDPSVPAAQLVTVGSQGSQLYRMGALPGLPEGATLPDGFPGWTNVFSPHDLLSYLAAPVFGPDKVTDIEISGARTMPAAHSAYFSQDALYELLAGLLDREAFATL